MDFAGLTAYRYIVFSFIILMYFSTVEPENDMRFFVVVEISNKNVIQL